MIFTCAVLVLKLIQVLHLRLTKMFVSQGKLSKERVRACFDGSLWPILEEENKNKQAAIKAGKGQKKLFKNQ